MLKQNGADTCQAMRMFSPPLQQCPIADTCQFMWHPCHSAHRNATCRKMVCHLVRTFLKSCSMPGFRESCSHSAWLCTPHALRHCMQSASHLVSLLLQSYELAVVIPLLFSNTSPRSGTRQCWPCDFMSMLRRIGNVANHVQISQGTRDDTHTG